MDELKSWKRGPLAATPHKLLNDLVKVLVDFYDEHIRRDYASGRLQTRDVWHLLRGCLIAGMQTYASTCILVSKKRPKPLMLQAGVLNRALFEILATVFGILENPPVRSRILVREAHKSLTARYEYMAKRWGNDQSMAEYLEVFKNNLIVGGKQLGLSAADALRPEAITDEWPTPGVMIYGRPGKKIPPFVTGPRWQVLKDIYQYHYPHQSAQAHGRVAAMAVALLVDEPELQWNPGMGESNIVGTGLLFMACLLSELQAAGGYDRHPKLTELWTYLLDIDGEAKDLWRLRYEQLAADT